MKILTAVVFQSDIEDYIVLVTDVPSQYPTRKTNAAPFDTRRGNTLRLRFVTPGGKGARYCRKHWPAAKIVVFKER